MIKMSKEDACSRFFALLDALLSGLDATERAALVKTCLDAFQESGALQVAVRHVQPDGFAVPMCLN